MSEVPLYWAVSYERGTPVQVRYARAQLSKGLEEALSTMKPGGARMVFMKPELSFACPKVGSPRRFRAERKQYRASRTFT